MKQPTSIKRERCEYYLSRELAIALGAENDRCWRNAAIAALTFASLFPTGQYIEGWIVILRPTGIELWEHGWCFFPPGVIVDPTIVLGLPPNIVSQIVYFPGFHIQCASLHSHLDHNVVPLVCHSTFGGDGMGHEGYREAYRQASHYAQTLADQKSPPLPVYIGGRDRTATGWTLFAQE